MKDIVEQALNILGEAVKIPRKFFGGKIVLALDSDRNQKILGLLLTGKNTDFMFSGDDKNTYEFNQEDIVSIVKTGTIYVKKLKKAK